MLSYCNRFQRVTASGPRCGGPQAVALPLVPTAGCTVSHLTRYKTARELGELFTVPLRSRAVTSLTVYLLGRRNGKPTT